MSLVVLDEVTLFFGDRMIFDAASLRLGHNDKIGLIGPNGSGKTTLLKIVAAPAPPAEVRRLGADGAAGAAASPASA